MKNKLSILFILGLCVLVLLLPAVLAEERCYQFYVVNVGEKSEHGWGMASKAYCDDGLYGQKGETIPTKAPEKLLESHCEAIYGSGNCVSIEKATRRRAELFGPKSGNARSATIQEHDLGNDFAVCSDGDDCNTIAGEKFLKVTVGTEQYYCEPGGYCFDQFGTRVARRVDAASGVHQGDEVLYVKDTEACRVPNPANDCLQDTDDGLKDVQTASDVERLGINSNAQFSAQATDDQLRFGAAITLKDRDGEKILGPDRKPLVIAPIKGSNGVHVRVKTDKGSQKDPYYFEGPLYDRNGKPIPNARIQKDANLIIIKRGSTEYRVDSKGNVYRPDDTKPYGSSFTYLSSHSRGGAEFAITRTFKEGDKKKTVTTIYGRDGEELAKDGKAFTNGAYIEVKEGVFNDVFHNRFGVPVDGAVSDGQGGYFVNEYVSSVDGSAWLHHFPNGRIFGERGIGGGNQFNPLIFVDSTYHFGTEGAGGRTVNLRTYERCIGGGRSGKYYCAGAGDTVWEEGTDGTVTTLSDEAKDNLFKDSLFGAGGIGSFGWRHFGDALDTWVGLTSNRYFSMFYSDEEADYYKDWVENDFVRNVLGGIDGWSSGLCDIKQTELGNTGGSLSPIAGGTSYAHIEAQRSKYVDFTEEDTPERFEYFFSITINPGECNMLVEPTIFDEAGEKRVLVKNVPKLKTNNETFRFQASTTSAKKYNKVCLEFKEISPGCLRDVSPSDPICNSVVDGNDIFTRERQDEPQASRTQTLPSAPGRPELNDDLQ